jgi:fructokinase
MKKVICFGEILWDVFPDGKKPGGAPMNVAYHLHNQGVKSTLISSVGNDSDGRKLFTYLEDLGLDTTFIQTHTDLPTGTVDVLLNSEGKATYTIIKPVAWDAIHFENPLTELVEDADAIVFGSLACRGKEARNTLYHLLEHARVKIFDLNLRPPHVSPEILRELLHASTILKVNDEEFNFLKEVVKIEGWGEPAFKELSDKFALECLCVTMGDKGALVWHADKLYCHPGYKVNVADTVGSGDAFLASFINGYLNNHPIPGILDKACVIGAYVASQSGANPAYAAEQVFQRFGIQK